MSLSWLWITRATTEGMRWIGGFLAMEGGDPQVRAWATFIRGFLAVLKADPSVAKPELEAAIAAARRNGQQDLLTDALSMASVAEAIAGDRAAAARLLAEAQEAVAGIDYVHGRLAVLQARVFNAFFEADLATIRACATDGADLARQINDLYSLEIMLLNLGSAALMAGELAEAEPLLSEALATARRIDDRVAQFYLIAAHACHATLSGQAPRAATMFGAAETMRVEAGANVMPILATQFAQAEQAAAAMLGEPRFMTQFEAGRNLQRDAAICFALGESTDDAKPGQASPAETDVGATTDISPLGKREAEVALLIAEGLTNKQIATRLFISERTVDSHVRSILNKLGFRTRTQIATWVAG
jgi:DNA-binding CsgD family transcriptional regulator